MTASLLYAAHDEWAFPAGAAGAHMTRVRRITGIYCFREWRSHICITNYFDNALPGPFIGNTPAMHVNSLFFTLLESPL